MNQFTSHIDFKLTKKRLVIMGKNSSLASKVIRLLPLLPIFLFITFLFCDRQTNPDELYTDVQLTRSPSLSNQVLDSGRVYASERYFNNGELFTGTQNYYFKSDDKLFTSVTFKEGLRVKEQTFRRTGEEWYRVEIDYDFDTGEQTSIHGYDEGVLTMQSLTASSEHNGLDVYREWFPNGQLKFEMTSYSEDKRPIIYEGVMTRYDELGNITEQERYSEGELIEKIK
ncbi:MAG: hypothetical protein ACMZ7B_06510 [Balneola sp.]